MTNEERIKVLERKMDVVVDFAKGAARDIAHGAADRHDIAQLQSQIDGLTMEMSSLSCELQAIRAISK